LLMLIVVCVGFGLVDNMRMIFGAFQFWIDRMGQRSDLFYRINGRYEDVALIDILIV